MTLDELAARAGTTVDHVRRLREIGILAQRGRDEPFAEADLARIRFTIALGGSGVSEEDLARGLREGFLSLAFADLALAAPSGLLGITHEDLLAETGLPSDLYEEIRAGMGMAGPGDAAVRDDLAEMARLAAVPLAFGIRQETMVRAMRVAGESLQRIADFAGEVWQGGVERAPPARGVSFPGRSQVSN